MQTINISHTKKKITNKNYQKNYHYDPVSMKRKNNLKMYKYMPGVKNIIPSSLCFLFL